MLVRKLLLFVAFVGGSCSLASASAQEKGKSSRSHPDRPPIRYTAEEGAPKDKAAGKRRDYGVLEAILNDLTSPKNPEYRHQVKRYGPSREIVVNVKTDEYELDPDWNGTTRDIDNRDVRTIPGDMLDALKRRSREPVRSLADFKPASRDIIVTDLNRMFDEAAQRMENPDEVLRTRYPTAWGYVWTYLPGYANDGGSAAVVLHGGPSGQHSLSWVYTVIRKGQRWEVDWRHLCPGK
jgi:hypothetical protein